MTFKQGWRFTATTVDGLKAELNTFVERIQVGALVLYGVKFDDTTRTAAPANAPATGEPNLVMVNVAGVKKLYVYDGTNWLAVGTQV